MIRRSGFAVALACLGSSRPKYFARCVIDLMFVETLPSHPVMHIPGPSVASAFISVHWIAADVARSGVPTTVLPIIHPALITQAKHVSFSGGRCSDTKSVDKATIKVRGTHYCPYIAAFSPLHFLSGGEEGKSPSVDHGGGLFSFPRRAEGWAKRRGTACLKFAKSSKKRSWGNKLASSHRCILKEKVF